MTKYRAAMIRILNKSVPVTPTDHRDSNRIRPEARVQKIIEMSLEMTGFKNKKMILRRKEISLVAPYRNEAWWLAFHMLGHTGKLENLSPNKIVIDVFHILQKNPSNSFTITWLWHSLSRWWNENSYQLYIYFIRYNSNGLCYGKNWNKYICLIHNPSW